MSPQEHLKHYESLLAQRRFEVIAPLISEQAIFWFNDGTHRGLAEIRAAFERTWMAFPDEVYWLENIEWIALSDIAASCAYHFRWSASRDGRRLEGGGRGTTVLRVEDGGWKTIHEHLSRFPQV
ncbi:DUF4440 domain-containing protein [Xaviernesmea oryzae]|uniref:DUF4440 domain-containing protein n=1 Tax=Xaviernesmea oryzae TaxID=464029 RepID=A0A1Q9AQX4_9HYPH|nr:nuclear transport factor 2 family protein [Xaviernesmea oryzae]OLP57814.1 DUF4440 domain-containing protein [Xaviernesmea oryzae]SEL35841.1 SnoaL-like domain-containing protein [Xaviernesmea oryzae]